MVLLRAPADSAWPPLFVLTRQIGSNFNSFVVSGDLLAFSNGNYQTKGVSEKRPYLSPTAGSFSIRATADVCHSRDCTVWDYR